MLNVRYVQMRQHAVYAIIIITYLVEIVLKVEAAQRLENMALVIMMVQELVLVYFKV